jgi:hypothetical protein
MGGSDALVNKLKMPPAMIVSQFPLGFQLIFHIIITLLFTNIILKNNLKLILNFRDHKLLY